MSEKLEVSPIALREFSRIGFDPEYPRLQARVYREILYGELRSRTIGQRVSPDEVIDSLRKDLQLRSVPPLLIQAAFREAVRDGILSVHDGEHVLRLRPPDPPPSPLEVLHAGFLATVEGQFGQLDRQQRDLAIGFLDDLLASLVSDLERRAETVLSRQTPDLADSVDAGSIVAKRFAGITDAELERASKLRQDLLRSVRIHFGRLSAEERNALGLLVQRAVICRVLVADPDLSKLQPRMFGGAKLLLDTNVLFALVCEGSQDHLETEWTLDVAKSLGFRLEIQASSLEEFERALVKDTMVYRVQRGSYIDPGFASRDLPRTFYKLHGRYPDWFALVAAIRVRSVDLRQFYGVQIVEDAPVALTEPEVQITREAIEGEGVRAQKIKDPNTVLHDLSAIQIIRELNEGSPPSTQARAWLLTRDRGLLRADARASRRLRLKSPSAIGYETFARLVAPILGAEAQADFVTVLGEVFRKQLAPIDEETVRSFVAYTLDSLGKDPSPEIVADVVAEAHFGRLAASLARDDAGYALEEVRAAVTKALPSNEDLLQARTTLGRVISVIKGTAGEGVRAAQTEAAGISDLASAIHGKLRLGIFTTDCPAAERDVQNALEFLLKAREFRVSRDTVQIDFGGRGYKPDFVVSFKSLDVPIEVKLVNSEDDRSSVVEELSADLTAYTSKWRTPVFVVYDCGFIRDQAQFAEGFERKGAVVIVVKH